MEKATGVQLDDPARTAWARVLERARAQLSESSFNMWFAGARPLRLNGHVLEIAVPSDYAREWLDRRYGDLIRDAVTGTGTPDLKIRVFTDTQAPRPDLSPPHGADGGSAGRLSFPDRYTFDTFVPGPSNRFAHAAAMAVAEAPPSRAYNPLFVYGDVGLGKTHLLHAIGHHMLRLSPRLSVKYVTSEAFVTEFIKAVRAGQGYQFQRRYREVDVLLVDDIQFLARAEETQTEFFHTFNALHAAERQIVIASDRPPQELSRMEERLRNRFRQGLCVDVQPPDLETRIAILQMRALRDGLEVPEPVLHLIASRFDQNIRELEGALLRVTAYASLCRRPIDLPLAEEVLEQLLPRSPSEIPPQVILSEAAAYFGLSQADLVSKSRSRPLTTARHVAMYLLRECTGLSLIKIGEQFDRDHTTVMHGIKKVETLMRARGSTYRQVQDLTRKVRGLSPGG